MEDEDEEEEEAVGTKKCVETDGEDEGHEGSTLAALPPRKKLCTCFTGDWEGHSLDWCRKSHPHRY